MIHRLSRKTKQSNHEGEYLIELLPAIRATRVSVQQSLAYE